MIREEKLVRQISATGIWLLAVNGMIGAGIFGVPAGAAALTGIYSPLVFLACGLLLMMVVLCFAELSSYFRGTGGPILYIGTAFGKFAGFQAGWAFYFARATAFAANINLLVASIAYFWEPAGDGAIRILLLALIVFLLTVPNVLGTRHAMRSIGILTVLKILPLLMLVIAGLAWLDPAAFPVTATPPPGVLDIGSAVLLVIYAFVGWEAAVVPAGETRDPARDMPRALLLAMGVVTLIYVLIQAVAVAVLPNLAGADSALIEVGAVLFGPAGAVLLTVGVVISIGGNVASTMVTAPRLTYSLAREGSLPAWFGEVHAEHRTPARSIVAFAVLVFLLSLYGGFIWLAAMSSLVRVLIYMACIASMPRLRRAFGHAPARFRLPGGWLVPGAAFAVSAALLLQTEPASVIVTAGFLLAGSGLYVYVRRKGAKRDA